MRRDFGVIILSHGRPDRVVTYKTLMRAGYTGNLIIVVDDQDKSIDQYKQRYNDKVVVFDKQAIANEADQGDNFNDLRTTLHVRNASFQIARDQGWKYFIQLDDDYTEFQFRFDSRLQYFPSARSVKNINTVFESLVEFVEKTSTTAIAIAQGGDFIGGAGGTYAEQVQLMRKCMNSFVCSVDRPFKFYGRLNEDVNTYVVHGKTGKLFFTLNQLALNQKQTQTNSGGMTDTYRENGTYIKSFFTVMYQPSSVKVRMLSTLHRRLHHSISWRHTVPKILDEKWRRK